MAAIEFEKVCEQGAIEFRGLWLQANQVAADAIRMTGNDPSERKTKTMMALAVLRVLVLARFHYTGEKPKPRDQIPAAVKPSLESE